MGRYAARLTLSSRLCLLTYGTTCSVLRPTCLGFERHELGLSIHRVYLGYGPFRGKHSAYLENFWF